MKSHECPATVRVCKDCKHTKPVGEFYVKRTLKSGLPLYKTQCKVCENAASAQRYERRRDEVLARCKQYRAGKKDQIAQYMRDYYIRNRDEIIAKTKVYQAAPERKLADKQRQQAAYAARRDEVRARQNAYNATPEGKAKQLERYKRHYAANVEHYTAKAAKRRALTMQAMPEWVEPKSIRPIYRKARQLTKKTGVQHHVDHIVPLKGRGVCGLHVPWNLQAIPAQDNLRKANRHNG